MKNLRENYSKLASRFSLPPYEELDKDFELLYARELFEINRPLVFVRRRICDKIGWTCGMLQGLIQPNPGSMLSIEESSFFTKEEKQENFVKLLKNLMYFTRKSITLDLESTDEEEAEFIKEICNRWNEVKPEIKTIAEQLKEGWKNDKESKKESHNHLG